MLWLAPSRDSASTANRELTGWRRLGIPTGDHLVIRRLVGIERAKVRRGDDSGAFLRPLGGRNHERVACDFLRRCGGRRGCQENEASLWRLLGGCYRAVARDDPVIHRYLLLLRFILANVIALALVGAAVGQGWVGAILAADQGGLCRAIFAVFVVGLVWSGQRALQLSRGLNSSGGSRACRGPGTRLSRCRRRTRRGQPRHSRLQPAAQAREPDRPIRHLANSLVLLGLIGTVVGFIIALSGVRPEVVSDVGAIGPMVSTLIGGMSVALYAALVGSLLHVWLMVNVRLLEGGTVKLLTATVSWESACTVLTRSTTTPAAPCSATW